MKRLILFVLYIFSSPVLAEPITLFSDEARYDGSLLILKGHVTVENSMGKVSAERAEINCKRVGDSLEPTKVTLFDHVQLIHQGTVEKPASHYALADELIYYPEEKLLLLEGKKGPVLFYDQLRHTQLAAKKVRAHYDPATGKESIEGVGSVRFIFGSDELEKIKQNFRLK